MVVFIVRKEEDFRWMLLLWQSRSAERFLWKLWLYIFELSKRAMAIMQSRGTQTRWEEKWRSTTKSCVKGQVIFVWICINIQHFAKNADYYLQSLSVQSFLPCETERGIFRQEMVWAKMLIIKVEGLYSTYQKYKRIDGPSSYQFRENWTWVFFSKNL